MKDIIYKRIKMKAFLPISKIIKESKTISLYLVFTWLLATVLFIWMLIQGVRNTNQYNVFRYIIQGSYIVILLLYLYRKGDLKNQKTEMKPFISPNNRLVTILPVLGIFLILIFCFISDLGIPILILLLIISTVWILIIWRHEIKLYMIIQAAVVSAIAFAGGIPLLMNQFISQSTFILIIVFAPLMYISGGLLTRRTKLQGFLLFEKQYINALRSFILGCLLFIPLGLSNAVGDSPDTQIMWVTEWWMPLSLPLFSGITEEIWFRLFLINICYYLLYSVFYKKQYIAIIIAVVFSAITFGLGHERTWYVFFTTGLLYGLPMAVVFVKRDWEHSVGAHYMINTIPWIIAFLEN